MSVICAFQVMEIFLAVSCYVRNVSGLTSNKPIGLSHDRAEARKDLVKLLDKYG